MLDFFFKAPYHYKNFKAKLVCQQLGDRWLVSRVNEQRSKSSPWDKTMRIKCLAQGHYCRGMRIWNEDIPSGWKSRAVSPGRCSCTHVCCWNGWCAWLWFWTGWWPSIFSWFDTIYLLSVPKHEKHLAGKQYWTDDKVIICSCGLFSRIRMRASIPRGPSAATPVEEVCWPQGRLCWKINHIRSNSTIAS